MPDVHYISYCMQHRFNLIAAATLWSLSLAPAQAQADVAPADPSLRDKTLVTWVAPANLEQRGGSALTLDAGQGRFDGVVFGEMTPRKWMPGSEGALRTLREQANWPDETADGKTFVQMAIAYQDRQVTIYRNGRQYAQYVMNNPPLEHGAQSAVLMGMRHITQGDNVRFAGAIDDARIYDRALSAEQIAALKPNVASDIKPWAWWTFDDKEAKDRTGRFKAVKLAGGAKVEDGKLVLDGKNASLFAKASIEDSIRFRAAVGNLGDTIPFYNGQYHVFYLTGVKTSWEHIVSTDLVHWKELPTALIGDGAADGPDGQNMFTGCVVEKDGVFHLYYTGWNPRNPQGREWIMHATSTDLVKWTKHPEHGFRADGVQYFNRDFRDPYVFWNDQDKTWWMILNTTDAKTDVAGVGRLRSEDLIHWKQLPPLVLDPPLPVGETGTPECPDLFRSGDYWYLLYTRGVQNIRRSKDILGPYRPCEPFALDGRILCGKRMFDGKRHLYVAPLGDGVMCQPRELYAGPEGQLFQRPVAEVTAFFTKTLHQFDKARDVAEGFVLPTPGNCMLECSVQMDPQAELTITLRQQSDGGDFRTFVLRPKSQDVEFGGPGGREGRRCPLDASKPIKFQAFVQDSTIECFVNDQYGFTFGAQNYPKCALGFKVEGGKAKVLELKVKTHSPPASDKAEVPELEVKAQPRLAPYRPANGQVGDTWYMQREGLTHMFLLSGGNVGHATSSDLIHWDEQPTAVSRGLAGSYDEEELWTGCTVEHGGAIYLYYCNNKIQNGRKRQGMSLATSKDGGKTFTKYAGNPVFEPDPKWYYTINDPVPPFGYHARPMTDCRDLIAVKDPSGGWLGYVVMRRKGTDAFNSACIGLWHSKDLVHWESRGPCFTPNRHNCVEVPDVFKLGEHWYMLLLSSNGYGQSNRWTDPGIAQCTIVAMADKPEGPFEEVMDNFIVVANDHHCGSVRTVQRNGERLALYTRVGGRGNRVSLPLKLVERPGAGLTSVYWPGIDKAFGPAMKAADVELQAPDGWKARSLDGFPKDARARMVTASISFRGAEAAGVAFRHAGATASDPGYAVVLDAPAGEVALVKLPEFSPIQKRRWPVMQGGEQSVRIVAVKNMFDVYIDNKLVLCGTHMEIQAGGVSLLARKGLPRFGGIECRAEVE